jgi:hypothetical protein
MSDLPTTFDTLIADWGIAQFADAIGVSYPTANAMKQRNSVAPKYWATILKRAPRKYRLSPMALLAMQEKSGRQVAA